MNGHKNAKLRPAADEYYKALENLEYNIKVCGVNSGHLYYYHAAECPWCKVEQKMKTIGQSAFNVGAIPSNSGSQPKMAIYQPSPSISMPTPQQQFHNMLAVIPSKRSHKQYPNGYKRIILFILCVCVFLFFSMRPFIMTNNSKHELLKTNNNYDSSEILKDDEIPMGSSNISAHQIEVGSFVFIREGAVYGGLASSRGKPVPKRLLYPTVHTITRIETHHGEQEALLKEINSWVALVFLITEEDSK